MRTDRRNFLKHVGLLSVAGACLDATGDVKPSIPVSHPDALGVLVDTTACVGCRLCEYACKQANHLPCEPLDSFNDQSVFKEKRRPSPTSLTVVNQYSAPDGTPIFVKSNCLHCNHPACESACIVGAMRKQPEGPVTYDEKRCIGCRYCMVACPFQIPTYEYDNVLTPRVKKCEMCFQERTSQGLKPGCVEACPREALIFGKRAELLGLAHELIDKGNGKYVSHVYGEHEVGGTSWLYLASVPFDQLGFLPLAEKAPPDTTEKIQDGIFRFGRGPLGLYAILGTIMLARRGRRSRVVKKVSLNVLPASAHSSVWTMDETLVSPTLSAGAGKRDYDPPAKLLPYAKPETHAAEKGHDHDEEPRPVNHKLFTPGVFVLLALMLCGLASAVWRFGFGFASSTNLDQQHPWGLWVAIDVASGVALAAGGFAAAALTVVFNIKRFRPIYRPALLTAMLGYTAVVTGLQADLGRYYNVWHPLMPWMWQGKSVLFEVGICEFVCLNLLYVWFAPIILERLDQEPKRFPRIRRLAKLVTPVLERVLPFLILAGCVAAALHQSALGNLLVITPYKLHPLWHTPILSALFLVSAIGGGGFAMMCWESLFASWCLKLKPEMQVLSVLAKIVPAVMGLYLVAKLADLYFRHAYVYLRHLDINSISWVIEVAAGVAIPVLMLLFARVRNSPRWLFAASTLIVAGVIFNRVNVFLIGFHPPYAKTYVPSIAEFGITLGLIAFLMFGYRLAVTYLPIISQPRKGATV